MLIPNFKTTHEACALLGICYMTMLKHIHSGYLKAKKFGHCYLIPDDEIREYIREGKKRGPGRPASRP